MESFESGTYKEAIICKQKVKWKEAMSEEINSLVKNNAWTLLTKPTGKKVLGSKWIYKLKEGAHGIEKIKYKARMVTKG